MSMINIKKLRVVGTKKDYSVRFDKKINIIAGEISTGKSSILDLIDYCLGAGNHPNYIEIQKKGRIAFLEILINEETFVIERQLFSTRQKAQIHICNLSALKSDHEYIEVSSVQRKDEESISSFLLSKIDLWNIPLRKAPTKDSSDIDIMSFRDVLWFCYLKRDRVGGNNLLFENIPMKGIKLKQVFDVLFGLHSDRLAILCSEISRFEEEIQNKNNQIKITMNFVDSEGIPELEDLISQKKDLNQEISNNMENLEKIDSEISGKSELAMGLRKKVIKLQSELQNIRVEKRNYKKTLQRLIPLRGQYSEDISKLHFLREAKRIIDPLRLSSCPVCLSSLDKDEKGKYCSLCGKELLETENLKIDVTKEVRIIERKLKELNSYTEELEEKIKEGGKREEKVSNELSILSKKLDKTLKRFVSPYLTEREDLISSISRNQNEIKHIDVFIKIRTDIEKVIEEQSKLQIKLDKLSKELDEAREKSPDRKELIESLSRTFYDQLSIVKFPKLADAYIGDNLIPFVRDIKYKDLSSEGAINIISICWMTSIYFEAIKKSRSYPGFLMLDGVQRGIGVRASDNEIEFRDESIIKGIYTLLQNLVELDEHCQIIVVDNHPPSYMNDNIVVYYSRNPEQPPYGFIDDEIS